MKFYAIDISILATAYLKVPTAARAQTILDEACFTQLDALDRNWFSEAAFECAPKFSLSTGMTPLGPIPGTKLIEVSERAMRLAMRPSVLGSRNYLYPWLRKDAAERTPVFWLTSNLRQPHLSVRPLPI